MLLMLEDDADARWHRRGSGDTLALMSRRKKKAQDPVEHFMSTCGWCGKSIPDDVPVCAGGGKLREGVDLSHLAGQTMELYLTVARRSIQVAVSTPDSQAVREGWDFVFMACSADCARQIKAAFDADAACADQSGSA